MYAVGVDVSNGCSTVAVLRSKTDIAIRPFNVTHNSQRFANLLEKLGALDDEIRVVMEQSYPGVRSLFSSPVRSDGSQKWVDFAKTFWHVDCVAKLSLNAFTVKYQKWCKRHDYNFSGTKATEIYEHTKILFPLVPKLDTTKLLVREAITQFNTISHTAEVFRAEMNRLAAQPPKYEAVMAMTGVGLSAGPQLMAEIGDVRRFAQKNSLVAFAGIDLGRNDSGSKESDKGRTSKRGSPHLRKTLFVIMSILLQMKPADDPVYQFLDKKRSEGKTFYVYMTAGGTKFLRIGILLKRRASGTSL